MCGCVGVWVVWVWVWPAVVAEAGCVVPDALLPRGERRAYSVFHPSCAHAQVRAGRHSEVLPMVYMQSDMVRGGKCVPVCAELASCNQSNTAIRLAM